MNQRNAEQNIALLFLLFSIAVFIIHFMFFRHSFPVINIDEGSFFSPAYSLAHKGLLASDIHKSFLPGSAVYTYWMPPLYIVLLGVVFKIFGSTVIIAKLVSLLLSGGSVLLLASLTTNRVTKLTAAALFLICPFIIITSAFIRVEALAIFITALSIVAVKRHWHVALLGVIAALAAMTHPLMLACGAGLALAAFKRGWKPFFIFTVAFLVAFSPYIWYIMQDVALFKEQMTLQFLRKSKAKFLDLKASYLLQSVPMVLLALYCLYKVKVEKELRLFIAVSMLLSLLVILKSNEFNYQVYLVPYIIAALVLGIDAYRNLQLYRWIFPLTLYAFFGVMLLSKAYKYHFRTDKGYSELVNYLDKNNSWQGKHIYVAGVPDLSTHLLMNGQDVERGIPVPTEPPKNWFDKYNYVVQIIDNDDPENNGDRSATLPWSKWKRDSATTSNGAYSIIEFAK